jgi:hypothetical protein
MNGLDWRRRRAIGVSLIRKSAISFADRLGSGCSQAAQPVSICTRIFALTKRPDREF